MSVSVKWILVNSNYLNYAEHPHLHKHFNLNNMDLQACSEFDNSTHDNVLGSFLISGILPLFERTQLK